MCLFLNDHRVKKRTPSFFISSTIPTIPCHEVLDGQVLDHLHLQGDQVRHALEAALAGGLGAGERLLSAARGNNFQVAVGVWWLGLEMCESFLPVILGVG